ncbi:MAG: hypothetical protein WB504_16955, partial [Pseudolabrys sp.]
PNVNSATIFMAAMRRCRTIHAFFNIQIMGRMIPWQYSWLSCSELSRERQAMINSKNVVSALRRDVAFVWHAVIAVVFIGFATLAVAAALLDVLAIRH